MTKVWIDKERCTGCSACVEVCPAEAIALIEGKARIDDALCQGCKACVEVCPVDAIQPVIEIEAMPVSPRYPAAQSPGTLVPQPTALRENVIATMAIIGTSLALRAAQAVGRWLLRSSASGSQRDSSPANIKHIARGGGRQRRHRQRG